MYDLIGDIHGHAEELERLLGRLGYREVAGCYQHPDDRRAVFLGDYIDRGPEIGRVLEVVRGMVGGGSARALMGNHEFNAIAYHTVHPKYPLVPGRYLREHTRANEHQHGSTLKQLGGSLPEWVDWFKTLEPWLDLGVLRAVHACWDPAAMRVVANRLADLGRFTPEFMATASDPEDDLYRTIEVLLKGPEVPLPDPHSFTDKDGIVRRRIRVKWFEPAAGQTFRTYGFPPDPAHPEVPVPDSTPGGAGYPPDAPPVFFGHYWLRGEHPALLARNVACLDWSVAKGGMLAAYRWDGEQALDPGKLVSVRCECGL